MKKSILSKLAMDIYITQGTLPSTRSIARWANYLYVGAQPWYIVIGQRSLNRSSWTAQLMTCMVDWFSHDITHANIFQHLQTSWREDHTKNLRIFMYINWLHEVRAVCVLWWILFYCLAPTIVIVIFQTVVWEHRQSCLISFSHLKVIAFNSCCRPMSYVLLTTKL